MEIKLFFRKLFLLAFVTSMILFRTLLNRQLYNTVGGVVGGLAVTVQRLSGHEKTDGVD